MYRIAVCDDQPEIIGKFQELCDVYQRKYKIELSVYAYINPNMLVADLEEGVYYDIFFIDIEMPQKNGLSVITDIKNIHPDAMVIILTSYTQYAIDAIELEVFRYLVKQEMEGSFETYLNAAIKRIQKGEEKYYFIISPRRKIKISCNDIIYCYKEEKMSVLVTKLEEVRERKSLKRVLKDLGAVCDYFIMTERGYLLNMYYVEKIQKNMICMADGIKIPIGVTYMNHVRKSLSDFWRKRL